MKEKSQKGQEEKIDERTLPEALLALVAKQPLTNVKPPSSAGQTPVE